MLYDYGYPYDYARRVQHLPHARTVNTVRYRRRKAGEVFTYGTSAEGLAPCLYVGFKVGTLPTPSLNQPPAPPRLDLGTNAVRRAD